MPYASYINFFKYLADRKAQLNLKAISSFYLTQISQFFYKNKPVNNSL